MIGLDTNVLVRLLYDDAQAPEQVAAARSLEKRIIGSKSRIYLANVVLCEAFWVLANGYDIQVDEIVAKIDRLAANPYYILEDAKRVEEALSAVEAYPMDFADALIARTGSSAGCTTSYTFDKKASKHPDFSSLES